MENLFSKLDLDAHIKSFKSYFAREKPLHLQGDSSLHFDIIKQLQTKQITDPKSVKNLDTHIMHLSKQGTLKIYEIFEFVKMISYMNYLKKQNFDGKLGDFIDKIDFPDEILDITKYFNEKGELRASIDERFGNIDTALRSTKESIDAKFRQYFSTKKLDSFLVDRQIHFLNNQEALLVRGGFNHVLKANVIGRSATGFFYVVPQSLNSLKERQSELIDEKESIIFEYCKKISSEFHKFLPFLKFLDKQFDRFDHYNARVNFAKSKDMEFMLSQKTSHICLKDFKHPALSDPKSISVDFKGSVLMITGVNAGGKTMLLKSILSATLLAKYLIPMSINSVSSSIGTFKNIDAIIQDPQNASNDISTFAGRMLSFSQLFGKKDILVGVDEIELGTDADEAASLFYVIISKLISQGVKLIITTHHKRLASLLATKEGVELKAAIYDEKLQRPTFEFLDGTIGKSYAFETAVRYNIPRSIVAKAKEVYGEDKQKLNELIQKNIDLELQMRDKLKKAAQEEQSAKELKKRLENEKEAQEEEFAKRYAKLQMEFNEAINEAKKAAKSSELKSIHQGLNRAHSVKKTLHIDANKIDDTTLKIGDKVKYNSTKGEIIDIKKSDAIVLSEGIKLRVPLNRLKKTGFTPVSKKGKVTIQRPSGGSTQLDLHGLRANEALERLDKFISDALLNGLEEVLVYHGIGTGVLAHVVNEFLITHPSVKSFQDAPPSMGGYGAKVIYF